MAARIKQDVPGTVVELIEGRAGVFIVKTGSQTLWDKHARGDEFPDESLMVDQVKALVAVGN